jgi:hypothetical protein
LIAHRSGVRMQRVAGEALVGALVVGLLAGCADPAAVAPTSPTISYSPYTPTPPRAVDLRSASQALSLQISSKGVTVDGLKCRTDGVGPTAVKLHCTVITGGGAAHPDQVAEGIWNQSAGTVHLISVEAVPSTREPPLATVPVRVADEADISSAQVTRLVRPALVETGDLMRTDKLVCGALHASVAGCEIHNSVGPIHYFNVVLRDAQLLIYPAGTEF